MGLRKYKLRVENMRNTFSIMNRRRCGVTIKETANQWQTTGKMIHVLVTLVVQIKSQVNNGSEHSIFLYK